MLRINIFICLFILLLNNRSFSSQSLLHGPWRGELMINDTTSLPFNFNVDDSGLVIVNGTEHIRVTEISYRSDSVFIQLPVFNTEFRCYFDSQIMHGAFFNHTRLANNIIPFHAMHGISYRFSDKPERTKENIAGRWQVIFNGEEADTRFAVGIFEQDVNRLSGTFMTPTGDYRFLEGEIGGTRINLSCFDGSHAFLFTAIVVDEFTISGHFFSGTHWHDTWTAWRNNDAVLPDAASITFMKPGYNKIVFKLPDETGKLISWDDPQFKNKVMIIQLMGSWCPNCMDETRFLSSFYKLFHDKGVEIVAFDFERVTDSVSVWKSIKRVKDHFDVQYPILYAGSTDKQEVAKLLPMLNRVLAYPTTIFSDKEGFVKMIHTGFSGPATGNEYEKMTDRFDNFVWKLLKE